MYKCPHPHSVITYYYEPLTHTEKQTKFSYNMFVLYIKST